MIYLNQFGLEDIRRWLEVDIGGTAMLFFGVLLYFYPAFAFQIFVLIAALFIPILLSVLVREKRYGWILFFLVLVVIPGVFTYLLLTRQSGMAGIGFDILARAVPIVLFLIYCFFLRHAIPAMLDP